MKENRFNEHYIKFGVNFNLHKSVNMQKGYISPDLMNDLKFYSIGTTKLVKRYMIPIIASVLKNMFKRNRLKFDLSEHIDSFEYENRTFLFNYNRNNNPIISKFSNENLGTSDKQKDFLEDIFKPSIFMRINLQMNEDESKINLGNNNLDEVTIKIPVYYGIDINGEELLYSRVLLIRNNTSENLYRYDVLEYTLKETRKGIEEQFEHAGESSKTISNVDKNSLLLDSITYLRLINNLNKELVLMYIDEEDEKQPKLLTDMLYILNSIKTRIKEDEKEEEYKDLSDDEIQDRLNEIDIERKTLYKMLSKRKG